jgi:hypothetical protein
MKVHLTYTIIPTLIIILLLTNAFVLEFAAQAREKLEQ